MRASLRLFARLVALVLLVFAGVLVAQGFEVRSLERRYAAWLEELRANGLLGEASTLAAPERLVAILDRLASGGDCASAIAELRRDEWWLRVRACNAALELAGIDLEVGERIGDALLADLADSVSADSVSADPTVAGQAVAGRLAGALDWCLALGLLAPVDGGRRLCPELAWLGAASECLEAGSTTARELLAALGTSLDAALAAHRPGAWRLLSLVDEVDEVDERGWPLERSRAPWRGFARAAELRAALERLDWFENGRDELVPEEMRARLVAARALLEQCAESERGAERRADEAARRGYVSELRALATRDFELSSLGSRIRFSADTVRTMRRAAADEVPEH